MLRKVVVVRWEISDRFIIICAAKVCEHNLNVSSVEIRPLFVMAGFDCVDFSKINSIGTKNGLN